MSNSGRGRAIRRTLLALTATVSLLVGGYAGYVAVRHDQSIDLPAPDGPYAVGRVIVDWTDQARTDPLAPGPATDRRLSIWLWYPAPAGVTGTHAPYAPGPWAQLHLSGVAGLGETSFDAVHDHAIEAAPVAPGRFPITVWEPGLGFAAPQYTAIAENLASHGYLVVGVTPTYSANLTVINGQVVRSNAAGNPAAFDSGDLHTGAAQQAGDQLVAVWSADARFAATQAAALDHSGQFAGHVDATRVVYAGHSLGGAASLQACHDDPHCAAAVNLDGTQFGPVVHTGLRRPSLTLASADSCVAGTCRPATAGDRSDQAVAHSLFDAGTGPVAAYQIAGMHHFDFSDYDAYYLAAPLHSLLSLGSLPRNRGLALTDSYLAAFLDRFVPIR
jgi:dienelactone hydrolase